MLGLTEEDSTPLLLLEAMFQIEFVLLPRVHSRINIYISRDLTEEIFVTEYFLSPFVLGYSKIIEMTIGLASTVLCSY